MKGLTERCLSQRDDDKTSQALRSKAKAMKVDLAELKAWKVIQEDKLTASEQLRGQLDKQVEVLRQVLEDKEEEIKDIKDRLRQVKEDAIQEYRDSNALLSELGTSFVDGFDDCLHQVKSSFPDLDLSHITIDPEGQTPARPINTKGTNELFGDDSNPNIQSDGEAQ